jgi:hypothetical protein
MPVVLLITELVEQLIDERRRIAAGAHDSICVSISSAAIPAHGAGRSVPPFHLVVCKEKHAFPSYASADRAFIDSLLFPMRFMAPKFHFAAAGNSAVAIRM